jgi:DNA-directed RNA polymerase subunit RPC12/RpoP
MTKEESKKFYELFPEVDVCPVCGGRSPCVELNTLSEFADWVKDGRLGWTLHAISPTFKYNCSSCGKTFVRSRFGEGDER